MEGKCYRDQLDGRFEFPSRFRLSAASPPHDVVCERDDTGAYLLWQSTSVERGLRILRDGEILPERKAYPMGIYAYAQRGYLGACQIRLRVAGVLGSRHPSKRISKMNEMVPLGFIVVRQCSSSPVYRDEFICHPNGCEVTTVRFHYQSLIEFLQRSPLAEGMEIPPM